MSGMSKARARVAQRNERIAGEWKGEDGRNHSGTAPESDSAFYAVETDGMASDGRFFKFTWSVGGSYHDVY